MKTKRIAAGYYQGNYKGVAFEICKVEQVDSTTANLWYWMLPRWNEGGHDHFLSKRATILAAKEWIDENSNVQPGG